MTNSLNIAVGAGLPAFVILDLTPPGLEGGEARRRLASDSAAGRIPVLRFAAKGDGFLQGLFSRLERSNLGGNALLAVDEARPEPIVRGGLRIDIEQNEVFVNGAKVGLTCTEFGILRFLAERPGRVFSRTQIVKGAKGPSYPVTERSVDVQVGSIRKKLGGGGRDIETVRGVGYKFRQTSQEP